MIWSGALALAAFGASMTLVGIAIAEGNVAVFWMAAVIAMLMFGFAAHWLVAVGAAAERSRLYVWQKRERRRRQILRMIRRCGRLRRQHVG